MGLGEYHKKRKFDATPEPEGRLKRSRGNSFVIQKHRATRLHYDLRLEMEGVLRSWAVPKGPSFDPEEKRLAVQTEDHPVDYGDFEGVIPKGNYGAGKVIIWDHGTYQMVDPPTPEEGWEKGKFHFEIRGKKLRGEWVLVRTRREERQWIFFKVRDDSASTSDITQTRPESVVSGVTVEQVGEADADTRHWHVAVGRELEERGMKSPRRAALPTTVSPMLATLSTDPFDGDDWVFELKLDGIRAIVIKDGTNVEIRSRNDRSLTMRFPGLVRELRAISADSAVIDGEIVALDEAGRSRFNLVQPRINLTRSSDIEKAEESIPVFFYAFDLLHINGHGLTGFPLLDRKAVLRKMIPHNEEWIRYTDHVEGQGREFYSAAVAHSLEGVVAKRKDSTYYQRRSRQWLKIKATQSDDFVVVGFTPPAASRKHFGALVLGLYDNRGALVYVGRAGAGFDDAGLGEAHDMLKPLVRKRSPFKPVASELAGATWVRPDLVCEVKFNEWTPDTKLRAPVFERFRDDKDPRDCVLREEPADDASRVEESPKPEEVEAGGEADGLGTRVRLTNMTKTFWPDDGLTKGNLVRYYDRIAEVMSPYLADRPLVLKRYPDGIKGEYFYQKDAPDYTPDWLRTQELWSADVEKYTRYFIGADREMLIYLANAGGITENPWSSRLDHLDHPDYIIFDLDPVDKAPYRMVQKVALELKKVLDELNLRAYPKTSGASGIHVYLPILEDTFTHHDVRVFAEAIATIIVLRVPDLATIERVVSRRPKNVYIDFLQNVKGKTVAGVYSPRARPGAPVSAPLRWEELRRAIDPRKFNMKNIHRRLKRVGDLFAPVLTDRQDIRPFLEALAGEGK